MGIGGAVKNLRKGLNVRRAGWHGKNMYLWLHEAGICDRDCMDHDYVALSTVDAISIPWNASQADLLARDWEIC
ncbi:MAG: DUF2829 domain-containing protein [Candidatus Dormibacteria bacterium]